LTMRDNKTESGFTLLELSVVILIMVMMLSISMPRFSNLFESTLQKETLKIAGILNKLRSKAILKGENYKLVFNIKTSEYEIFTIDSEDPTKSLPHEEYPEAIKLKPPIEFTKVLKGEEGVEESKLNFKKLEFDKIFGQKHEFRIDSSGFIDLFSIELKDNKNSQTLSVVNIMGKIEIGQETPI